MNALESEPALSPLQRYTLITSAAFAGFAIPISTAALNIGSLLLLLCWLGVAPLRARTWSALRIPFVQACLALYALLILGTLWAEVDWRSRLDMLNRMRAYLLAPVFLACMTQAVMRRSFIAGFCAGVALSVLMSLGMAASGVTLLEATAGNYPAFRTHTYHNLFIAWVAAGLLGLLLWNQIDDRRMRLAAILVLVLLLLDAFFLVRGRTAQILLLMMIGLICLRRWGLRAALPIVLCAAVLLPGLYMASPVIREGAQQALRELKNPEQKPGSETSVGLRLEFAANTWKIIEKAPLSGHGTGSFKESYQELTGYTKASHGSRASHNPHNDYMWLWSEVGPLGAVGLLGILLAAALSVRRFSPAQRTTVEAIGLSMLVGTLANSFFTDNVSSLGFITVACTLIAGPWWPKAVMR